MTQSEQQAYWNKWSKFQQRYEKLYEPKFKRALKIQLDAFIKTQDPVLLPVFPLYEVLVSLYKTVGPAWARVTRTESIKADDNFVTGQMGFNARIVELMNQYYGIDLLNDANLMTQYSTAYIQQVLGDAAITGASFDDIVKQLLVSPAFNAMRARRIARTETVTSANGAAMIYANESGNVMEKVWIAVKDKRTRHDHRMVDGTRLPIETPFTLTNAKLGDIGMMQPGVRSQPNGLPVPAEEVVNCRCTVAFKAKRDRNGRIIRR